MIGRVLRAAMVGLTMGAICITIAASTMVVASAVREVRPRVVFRDASLPAGRKLAGVSWRDGTPWVITREAGAGERVGEVWEMEPERGWRLVREVYRFREVPALRSDAGAGP